MLVVNTTVAGKELRRATLHTTPLRSQLRILALRGRARGTASRSVTGPCLLVGDMAVLAYDLE